MDFSYNNIKGIFIQKVIPLDYKEFDNFKYYGKVVYDNDSLFANQKHIGGFDKNYTMQGEGEIVYNKKHYYKGTIKNGIPFKYGKMIKNNRIDSGVFDNTLQNGYILKLGGRNHLIEKRLNKYRIINKQINITNMINNIKVFDKRWKSIMNIYAEVSCNYRYTFKIILRTEEDKSYVSEEFKNMIHNNELKIRLDNSSYFKTIIIKPKVVKTIKGMYIGLRGLSFFN